MLKYVKRLIGGLCSVTRHRYGVGLSDKDIANYQENLNNKL